jgi:hypothetical protein
MINLKDIEPIDGEFMEKTNEDLTSLKKSLEHAIFDVECYSPRDFTLLFRLNTELAKREQ